MDIIEEFVKVLFDEDVIKMANELIAADRPHGFTNAHPIEKHDITFRLYKPCNDVVNLEFLSHVGNKRTYQPIGFYKSNKIYLLHEYVEAYKSLFERRIITHKAHFLTTIENAVIASFALSTVECASNILKRFNDDGRPFNQLEKYDVFADINGLRCELLLCDKGYPQLFLDDKYNINGHIGAYIPNSRGYELGWHKNVEKEYALLKEQELLTAYTKF